jgi:hypothetical protein
MTALNKRAVAMACAGLVAAATAAVPAAGAGAAPADARGIEGLNGPRGLDMRAGKMVVADSDGVIHEVIRRGPERGTTKTVGKVTKGFGSAVAVARNGDVWAVTGGAHGTLYLFREGHQRREVVDIGAWQKRHNPDPYDIEDKPRESNPFGLAAMDDGTVLVADAANNSVLHVTRRGKVTHIARVKTRVVEMPEGYDDPELPPAGTPLPTESVVTSVAVGPDGWIYLGELRGFPGTPGTSQIWKVRPGATDAVCRPNKPNKGACTRFADGLTSVVALETGRGGAVYAAELSKMSWLAAELEVPGAEVGSVIRISHDQQVRRELSPGKVVLPGGVAVGGAGNVFVSGPVFGPGGVMRVH